MVTASRNGVRTPMERNKRDYSGSLLAEWDWLECTSHERSEPGTNDTGAARPRGFPADGSNDVRSLFTTPRRDLLVPCSYVQAGRKILMI